jgi:hypothetical protein
VLTHAYDVCIIDFMGMFSHRDQVEKTTSGISIEDVRNDMPEFCRVYTAELVGADRRCTIRIEMKTWSLGLNKSGELTQHDGRWVTFDPDKIADKILDRALVPLISKYVDEIYGIDKAFRKSNPAQFIDERGVTWRRA